MLQFTDVDAQLEGAGGHDDAVLVLVEGALGRLVMDQQRVRIPAPGKSDRLAGADRDHPDIDRMRTRDLGQQPIIKTRVSHRCGRRQLDRSDFGPQGQSGQAQSDSDQQLGRIYQNNSPARNARAASLCARVSCSVSR